MEEKNTSYIFVTVAGSTPQIITESLYDLIIQQKKKIGAIHIITTLHGERRCEEMIKAYPDGQFYKFCTAYELNPMDMPIHIHVITDENGHKLEDIRDKKENESAANFIDGVIQDLCARDDVTVLASLSGGRKTMSAYMAYAMQMYGRRRDRLFHVLVSPPELEFNREFFFPPVSGDTVTINTASGSRQIKTDDIAITNAEIPFVRLNDFLDFDNNLNVNLSYTDKVGLTQKSLDSVYKTELDFSDMENGNLTVIWQNNIRWTIHMKRAEITLYKYIYDIKEMHNSTEFNPRHVEALNRIYKGAREGIDSYPDYSKQGIVDFRSKINKAIRDRIGNKYIEDYITIESIQQKPYPIYVFGKASGQTS
ncbi:MAG: TIGR02584 family CRISPR-associated protein [Calditrichaeota bacterium]|nr:MAG: TIGR02584 family CRISPR-associated protein [Calditrichota bacterium]